jgi:cytoskeletal protein CcmA (bactofilin family)
MKLRKLKTPEVRGFLDIGTELFGDLRFSDVLHLHGRLKGCIISEGELVVGEHGIVEGNVEIGVLTLGGTITGNIVATQKIHLLNTGRVQGDIYTPIIKVDEGAMLEGNINTVKPKLMKKDSSIQDSQESAFVDIRMAHAG